MIHHHQVINEGIFNNRIPTYDLGGVLSDLVQSECFVSPRLPSDNTHLCVPSAIERVPSIIYMYIRKSESGFLLA